MMLRKVTEIEIEILKLKFPFARSICNPFSDVAMGTGAGKNRWGKKLTVVGSPLLTT